MTMNFPPAKTPTALEVCVQGELDLFSASAFAGRVIERIEPRHTHVLLDFSLVGYLDSSGTGAIIRIIKACHAKKAAIGIAGLRPGPRRVLAMVNLFEILPSYESIQDFYEKAGAQHVRVQKTDR
jgi:anti-anti-sigma factor